MAQVCPQCRFDAGFPVNVCPSCGHSAEGQRGPRQVEHTTGDR